ncbi:type II secretion system F family protein, partial [Nocardioides aquaticus]
RRGGAPTVEAGPAREPLRQQAGAAAARLLSSTGSLEGRIAHKLERAGSGLKAQEWLVVHVGIALVSAVVGVVLGGPVLLLVGLLLGVVLPWVFLGLKAGRRRKAFDRALPETLQLISGSLSAGLSLAQSIDTVVRDGVEVIATEFKRVLVETRLGVPLEDALDGVAKRYESKDFAWVVMAIRIQRQVGGNLAELLDTVAATMREREYIRRQVSALAAEGKLSAVVLAVLPPGFMLYLLMANREYVMVLFTDPRGLVILIGAAVWLSLGIFWMSKLVKVEV